MAGIRRPEKIAVGFGEGVVLSRTCPQNSTDKAWKPVAYNMLELMHHCRLAVGRQ